MNRKTWSFLQSDIDAKVLAVQHYKLSERFRLKERQTSQLQHRVEQLESRQAQDDAMMCTINRFWNRVIFLQIFFKDWFLAMRLVENSIAKI